MHLHGCEEVILAI